MTTFAKSMVREIPSKENIKEIFEELDTNNDNGLSFDEIKVFLERLIMDWAKDGEIF